MRSNNIKVIEGLKLIKDLQHLDLRDNPIPDEEIIRVRKKWEWGSYSYQTTLLLNERDSYNEVKHLWDIDAPE